MRIWKVSVTPSFDAFFSSSVRQIHFINEICIPKSLVLENTWNEACCHCIFCITILLQPFLGWWREDVSGPPVQCRNENPINKDQRRSMEGQDQDGILLLLLAKCLGLTLSWIEKPFSRNLPLNALYWVLSIKDAGSNSTTTLREIWLTTAIKYSATTWEKQLL